MMSAKNLKLPTVKIEPEVDKRSLMDKMKERQLAKKSVMGILAIVPGIGVPKADQDHHE